jgi:parallel beta-helix repeat protein
MFQPTRARAVVLTAVALFAAAACTSESRPPNARPGGGGDLASPFSVPVGAVALGTARYPVPARALFVAPGGNNANPGTQARPFATAAHAVKVAPSGSTIVLRRGTYHEYVEIFRKKLTLQPYPGELVLFDGARRESGFVRDGAYWRKDGFASALERTPHAVYVERNAQAAWPDQVFVDGYALREVGSRSQLGVGKFFVDRAARRLYLGTNPTGRRVEASRLADAVFVNQGNGSVVRGIGFRRYGTPISRVAAVKGFANDLVFENNVFEDNAAIGLSVRGSNVVMRSNTARRNGQMGLHSDQSARLLVERNLLDANNVELFATGSAQGGIKLTRTSQATVRENIAQSNRGRGIWFDMGSTNNVIARNVVRHNEYDGIEYEISSNGVIAGNVVHDNGRRGIYVLESANVEVFNNSVVRNETAVYVLEGARPQNVQSVHMRNNLFVGSTPGASTIVSVDDATKRRGAAQMGVTADYNGYHRSSPSSPRWVAGWCAWPRTQQVFTSVSSFRRAGQEVHGVSVDGGREPFFVNSAKLDFRLRAGNLAASRGMRLPSHVAAAIGVPAGTVPNLGAPVG